MVGHGNRNRNVAALLLSLLAATTVAVSCSSSVANIPDDADPKDVSTSRLTFESARPLIAGGVISDGEPLVVAFTSGARLERGSLVAIAFPTAVQEEAGDLWSIPVATPGASGSCRTAPDSADRIEIALAGRVKGGAGRIVFRTTKPLEAGATVRILLTGQVPKIVPLRPFRVIELDAATGRLSRVSDENIALPPVVAGTAVRVLATLPSDATVGQRVRLRLAAIDAFGNVDKEYRNTIRLSGPVDGLPSTVTIGGGKGGVDYALDRLVARTPGIARITVVAPLAGGESTRQSNPLKVWSETPRWRRFVGDPHFHTGSDVASLATDGGDHRGQFVASGDAFSYLRYVTGADWGISAEHDTGLSETTWIGNQQRVASFEMPGEFVTLLGYEWTPPRRLGHHVVVFEGQPGSNNPLIGASSGRRGGEGAANVAELAAALRSSSGLGHRVLLIPHVMQPFPNDDVDREDHSLPHAIWDGPKGSAAGAYVLNDLRRVGEIYSHHNDDFTVDGHRQTREGRGDAVNQPQLFELGVGNSWSYQHAWATGHRIGVLGGSDNHFGTPGLNDEEPTIPHHAGLSVVFASGLTHGGLFSGLFERRCYATTGARILVEVAVDGLKMGEESSRPLGARIPIRVDFAGTARIESVEVLKLSGGDFVVLPGSLVRENEMDGSLEIVDTLDASTLYYVRVRQSDGEWAWTSPVWIDVAPASP